MRDCFCSIFNTREERLVDEEGQVTFRLICNICGSILDSREEHEVILDTKNKAVDIQEEGEAMSY